MRTSLVGCVGVVGLMVAACSGATEEVPELDQSSTDISSAEQLKLVKVDPDGKRWIPVRKVVKFDDSPPVARAPRNLNGKAATLSDEELAKKLKPIMLSVDDIEYTLEDDQALALAREVKEHMRSGRVPDGDSAFGEGEKPVVSTSRTTQNDGVFDGESRTNANAFAQNYPWNLIGVMSGSCTIFKMINHYTAVTSAHCVYDGNGWKTRKKLQFSAGSATPRGELPAQCYAMTVPSGWSSDVGDDEYDYAVIRLREGGSTGAWCNYNDYNTGYFGYQGVSGCTTNVGGDLAGYPGKGGPGSPPPGAWVYPTLFNDYRNNGWTSCVTYPNHLWYYNDNSGGQSGGPFWSNFSGSYKVRAVNMAIWTGVFDDSNAGRRIDQSVIDFLNAHKGY